MKKQAAKAVSSMIEDEWNTVEVDFPINMMATLESGQPLHFHSDYKLESGISHMTYVTTKGVMQLRWKNAGLSNSIAYKYKGNYTRDSARSGIIKRLGLQEDMELIYNRINTDKHMEHAVNSHYGMRVTVNDPWETTLCYVISQFNNIKRIRGIVKTLISKYGEVFEYEGGTVRLFPRPEALASLSIEELKSCGTGFRAKYIKSVAQSCADGFDLERLNDMEYQSAKSELMKLDGVGDKVADCILLMGYGKLGAFPIDVWVKRAMENLYFNGKRKGIKEIHAYADSRWGAYAGYAQQYLFHGARKKTFW